MVPRIRRVPQGLAGAFSMERLYTSRGFDALGSPFAYLRRLAGGRR